MMYSNARLPKADPGRQHAREWTSDPTGERYFLTHGTCHATVWYSAMDHWTAFVSRTGASIGQHSFTTVQDAQAWCEARLTEFAADGYCAAATGAAA